MAKGSRRWCEVRWRGSRGGRWLFRVSLTIFARCLGKRPGEADQTASQGRGSVWGSLACARARPALRPGRTKRSSCPGHLTSSQVCTVRRNPQRRHFNTRTPQQTADSLALLPVCPTRTAVFRRLLRLLPPLPCPPRLVLGLSPLQLGPPSLSSIPPSPTTSTTTYYSTSPTVLFCHRYSPNRLDSRSRWWVPSKHHFQRATMGLLGLGLNGGIRGKRRGREEVRTVSSEPVERAVQAAAGCAERVGTGPVTTCLVIASTLNPFPSFALGHILPAPLLPLVATLSIDQPASSLGLLNASRRSTAARAPPSTLLRLRKLSPAALSSSWARRSRRPSY